jgi:hypothetical protein
MIDQLSAQLGLNLEALIVQLFMLLMLVGLPVMALVDLIGRQTVTASQRALWVALIVLVPILGTVAYFTWGPVPEKSPR